MVKQLKQSFFSADAVDIAKKLLGKRIVMGDCEGIIVETEAYKQDPASHAYKITPRSQIMLDTHGHIYVYVIYGMYHCLNVTTNKGDVGAVLIRGIEPIKGIEKMNQRRLNGRKNASKRQILKNHELCSSPGKICAAFDITKINNNKLVGKEIKFYDAKEIPKENIVKSSRIGISEGKDLLWRFHIKDNKHVSVK